MQRYTELPRAFVLIAFLCDKSELCLKGLTRVCMDWTVGILPLSLSEYIYVGIIHLT